MYVCICFCLCICLYYSKHVLCVCASAANNHTLDYKVNVEVWGCSCAYVRHLHVLTGAGLASFLPRALRIRTYKSTLASLSGGSLNASGGSGCSVFSSSSCARTVNKWLGFFNHFAGESTMQARMLCLAFVHIKHTHTYAHACADTSTHAHTHTCMNLHTRAYTYVRTRTCTTHTRKRTRAHTFAHTCKRTWKKSSKFVIGSRKIAVVKVVIAVLVEIRHFGGEPSVIECVAVFVLEIMAHSLSQYYHRLTIGPCQEKWNKLSSSQQIHIDK